MPSMSAMCSTTGRTEQRSQFHTECNPRPNERVNDQAGRHECGTAGGQIRGASFRSVSKALDGGEYAPPHRRPALEESPGTTGRAGQTDRLHSPGSLEYPYRIAGLDCYNARRTGDAGEKGGTELLRI